MRNALKQAARIWREYHSVEPFDGVPTWIKLTALGALLLALCISSRADVFGQFSLGTTGPAPTNTVAALATNSISVSIIDTNVANRLDIVGATTIGIAPYYNGSNGISGSITFPFLGSVDGTNWTTPRLSGLLANVVSTGLTNFGNVTLSVGTFRYLKLAAIENTNTYSISNIVVNYYLK